MRHVDTMITRDMTDEHGATECCYCAFPLFTGERAWYIDETGEIACCISCSLRLADRAEERARRLARISN